MIQFEEVTLHTTHDLFHSFPRDRINQLSHVTVIRNTQKLITDIYPAAQAA